MYDESNDEDNNLRDEEFRPFVTIWTRPRDTVRQALGVRPMGLIYVLIIAATVLQILVNAYDENLVFEFTPTLTIIAIVLGAGLGLVGWVFIAWMYRIVGRWFGGRGTAGEMRIGLGIAYIPTLVASVFAMSGVLLLEGMYYSQTGVTFSIMASVVSIVFSIWAFVTQVKAIAEVHEFSAWRGLGTLLITGVIIGIVAVILALGVGLFFIIIFA